MSNIKLSFKERGGLYTGRHLEIRLSGSQIRFYEVDTVNRKEYCLKKDTVRYLMHKRVLPKTSMMKRAIKGDKSIFKS